MAIAPYLLTIVLALLVSVGSLAADGDLYVATNGNDAWSGALPVPNAERTDGPLRTLSAARDRIRPQLARMDRDMVIMVRGGTYDRALDRTTIQAYVRGGAVPVGND